MGVPDTMKALQLVEYNKDYKLVDIPIPKPGPNELLVRIAAASFCHTDYQVYQGVYKSETPIVPSHKPVGTITTVGSSADSSKWKVGQRVGILNFRHPCRKCRKCRWHKQTYNRKLNARFCIEKNMAGITHDGGFAKYLCADADATVLLPDSLEFEQAAPLMCAGATVWSALAQCNLKQGQSVAILRIGRLGILAVQFAKALGFKTIAIDTNPDNLNLSLDTGPGLEPDLLLEYNNKDTLKKAWEFTEDIGLKAVILRGVCVPLGLPEKGYRFNAFDLVFKELVIKGSLCASADSLEEMMKVVAKHNIRSHITSVKLEEAENLPTRFEKRNFKGRLVVTL